MAANWREVAQKIRNWGKWGPDDQLGTLNYITAEKIARATAMVKKGRVIPLGIPVDAYGPQGAHGFRRNPIHIMSVDGGDAEAARHLAGWGGGTEAQIAELWQGPLRFNDDYITMPLQSATQWDALSLIYYEGQMYNGFPASAVTSYIGGARPTPALVAAATVHGYTTAFFWSAGIFAAGALVAALLFRPGVQLPDVAGEPVLAH